MCARTCAHTCSFTVLFQCVYTRAFKLYFNASLVPPTPCPLTLTSSSPAQEPQRLDEGEQRLF